MSRFVYRVHALQRMFEREIKRSVVESVIQSGTTIESYPEDTPYPSRLARVGPGPSRTCGGRG